MPPALHTKRPDEEVIVSSVHQLVGAQGSLPLMFGPFNATWIGLESGVPTIVPVEAAHSIAKEYPGITILENAERGVLPHYLNGSTRESRDFRDGVDLDERDRSPADDVPRKRAGGRSNEYEVDADAPT